MFGVLVDAIVLYGLMWVWDRKNPNREVLHTATVILIATLAGLVLRVTLFAVVGPLIVIPYFVICMFLLHRIAGVGWKNGAGITASLVLIQAFEPLIFTSIFGR